VSSQTIEAGVDEERPRAAAAPRTVPAPLRSLPSTVTQLGGQDAAKALSRVGSAGQLAVAQLSYALRRLGSATLAGIVALIAAAAVFISYNLPQGAAVAALQTQAAHAPATVATVTASGVTLASLPPRSEAPDVVAKIYEEARAAGVELPRGQYEYVPPRDGVAARYRLTFPVHASYPQIRGFLDRTLIALPAVAVESLRIERKTVADGSVEAEVKFAAYVRGDP
jgi:hypothetical protein